MKDFFYLIPVSLGLGLAGLILFLWSLKNGQYEDLDGASERILYDDDKPCDSSPKMKRGIETDAIVSIRAGRNSSKRDAWSEPF